MRRGALAVFGLLLGGSAAVAEAQHDPPPRAAAPARPSRDYPRVRLDFGGAFAAGGADFTEDRTITQFAEDGRLATTYAADPGPGFEGGLLFRFSRRLGVGVAVSHVSRDVATSFEASFPHPLYFDRDREVAGPVAGVSQKETAVHLDLVYTATRGKMDLHLFAGPTRMGVSADLVTDVEYDQAYPFDAVTVTSTPTRSVAEAALGFNLGAALDYRLGGSFALGAQVRFTRARAELIAAPGSTVAVDGGGVQLGLGARVLF